MTRPTVRALVPLTAYACLSGFSAATVAAEPDSGGGARLSTVVVEGRLEVPKGELSTAAEALPSTVYVLDADEVEALPFSKATDILRQTPGITIGNSNPGGDIGTDISIRGFSSYHGADVAIYVDGVPVNWPNHGNRNGAADFNWLIPEMIERVEIIKGPFSALYGNFNLAGAVNFITRSEGATSVAGEAGSYGSFRAVGTYGRPIGDVTPYLVYEWRDNEGYRQHSEYKRYNAFNKFTFPLADGRLSVRFNASYRDFEASGFALESAVRAGRIGRRTVNPDSVTDNGENEYYTFVANYVPDEESGLTATAYAGHDRFEFFDTSFGPPQTFQGNQRSYAGWRVSVTRPLYDRALVTLGTDGQYDDGRFRSYDAANGRAINLGAAQRSQDVQSLTAGAFLQGQWRVAQTLKLVGGVRFDSTRSDIDDQAANVDGSVSAQVVSPKLGAVFTPWRAVEFFANTGKGFRSPASTEIARGGVINKDLDVATLRSSDVGVTLRLPAGVTLTGDYFNTVTQRELRRSPTNPNTVINFGETERDGYELELEWAISSQLNVGLSHVGVDTRLKQQATPGADRVITVPDDVQTANLSWHQPLQENLSLSVDFFGKRIGRRPLFADGSVYAQPQFTYGAKVRLARGRISGFAELDYAPNRYSSDFVFDVGDGPFYEPQPVLSGLLGMKYTFN
jgi:outer membrane receptor protein involved in Fe transport